MSDEATARPSERVRGSCTDSTDSTDSTDLTDSTNSTDCTNHFEVRLFWKKRMMKNLWIIGLLVLVTAGAFAQNNSIVHRTFRGLRLINGHSVETLYEGELEFLIEHRFGRINGGLYELFGLDQASMRMGLDYGITNRLNVGVGRSTYGKHLDAYVKYKLAGQTVDDRIPVTLTVVSTVAANMLRPVDPERPMPVQSRLAYTHQLLLARKWSDRFSTQLMPTFVHYNLVDTRNEHNDVFAMGFAARVQLTRNVAITGEYYYKLPGQLAPDRFDPIGIGFDINTGGHVFQLHFTNASSMIEKAFIGETRGDWLAGDIQFGFNMSRLFKLKGRRY